MWRAEAASRRPVLAQHSFLRRVDVRAKLLLSLLVSSALMLPPQRLIPFMLAYAAFVFAAGLGGRVFFHLRRISLFLCIVFAADWLLVDFNLAVLVTVRMVLLVTSFQLLVATTTADELRRGLESLGLPEAVSLALATAHRSVSLFEQEWRCIREAQMARGVFARARARARARRGWLRWRDDAHDAVALIVPAIVLATRRAWSLHEAATVRGIGAPRRAGPQRPRLQPLAHAVLGTVLGVLCLLILVR